MEVLLNCRICGYQEKGDSRNGLMNRVKLWNHVNRAHAEHDIKATEVRSLIRQDNEAKIAEEAYRLQASY